MSNERLSTRGGSIALRLSLALALLLGGCADEPGMAPAADGDRTPDFTPSDPCATPNEGCECDEPGEVVDCGVMKKKTETYVMCEEGSRTCVDGVWGACELSGRT